MIDIEDYAITTEEWRHVFCREQGDYFPKDAFPRPLPHWTNLFEQNVADTLEWMARRGRSDPALQEGEGRVVTQVRGLWFAQSWTEDFYYHVCEPVRLLQFRNMYESYFDDAPLVSLTVAGRTREKIKEKWMSLWSVVGRDGFMKSWLRKPIQDNLVSFEEEDLLRDKIRTGVDHIFKDGTGYRYRCSKCAEDMPKGIAASIKLNKIKDLL